MSAMAANQAGVEDAWVSSWLSQDQACYLVSPTGDIHGSVAPVGGHWVACAMQGQRVLGTANLASIADAQAFVTATRQHQGD